MSWCELEQNVLLPSMCVFWTPALSLPGAHRPALTKLEIVPARGRPSAVYECIVLPHSLVEMGRYLGYLTYCCSVLGNLVPPILHIL